MCATHFDFIIRENRTWPPRDSLALRHTANRRYSPHHEYVWGARARVWGSQLLYLISLYVYEGVTRKAPGRGADKTTNIVLSAIDEGNIVKVGWEGRYWHSMYCVGVTINILLVRMCLNADQSTFIAFLSHYVLYCWKFRIEKYNTRVPTPYPAKFSIT